MSEQGDRTRNSDRDRNNELDRTNELDRNADVELHGRLDADEKEGREEVTEEEPDVEAHRNLGPDLGRNV
ncbi:MAG: hypothetical protein M3R70_01715 [Actinomycetota bacterium]|nr:hypothetical protein [Actinomycetota bacterium]